MSSNLTPSAIMVSTMIYDTGFSRTPILDNSCASMSVNAKGVTQGATQGPPARVIDVDRGGKLVGMVHRDVLP